jgi:signal transduction histidine kinase/ActR/RegA family two-component response regulator
MVSIVIFTLSALKVNYKNNEKTLKKEAKNIESVILDSLDYTAQINLYVAKKIAEHGADDLKFILNLFRDVERVQDNNDIFSWTSTSFDWVNSKNYQTVNSMLGIRKDPPDMSSRQYTTKSPKNPFTLQVSHPVIGNPSGIWAIPVGTGITDRNKKYLGAVAVGLNIADFTNKISQRIGKNISFVVLDEELNIIMQSSDNELAKDDSFYKKNINTKIFKNNSGILSKKIEVGSIYYSYYKKLDRYPYIIISGFNSNFLNKEFTSLILPRLLEFICLTAFFLLILYLFKSKIIILLNTEKELRASLHQANLAKTNFLRSTSHDLKNYIVGISGLAKLVLSKKTMKESDEIEFMETIAEQSDEMMHFLEDLLDTNQSEVGEFSLQKLEECDVNNLINRMVLLNQNFANEHQIKIKTNLGKNIPNLICDIRRFKQILYNLITNGIKYNKPCETLLITTKYLKNQIYIEFKDSGIGMTDDEITALLSGDGKNIDKSSLDKKINSNGIGMKIVQRLVELHNGRLEIDSQKNIGTKIKLFFDARDALPTSSQSAKNFNTNSNKKSILFAEDEPVNAKITMFVLQNAGYDVVHVKDGKSAIRALEKQDFDLILTDIEMPIMNGFSLAEKIREGSCFKKFKNYKTIPIIAFTANSDDDTINKIKACGMNDYISKSGEKEKLLAAIYQA